MFSKDENIISQSSRHIYLNTSRQGHGVHLYFIVSTSHYIIVTRRGAGIRLDNMLRSPTKRTRSIAHPLNTYPSDAFIFTFPPPHSLSLSPAHFLSVLPVGESKPRYGRWF